MGGGFLYYNKVEISGVNTAKLKVLKESEKMELLQKCVTEILMPEKSL